MGHNKSSQTTSVFQRHPLPPPLCATAAAAVGPQVTASHNAEPDNGIKMVDSSGGMLSQDWEGLAQAVANAAPADALAALEAAAALVPGGLACR